MADKSIRCAVYTRKSTEEGLEQSFNSLHAQREACEAFVLSQKHEGWQLIPTEYDDGGFSGGSMDRPGLQALLSAVDAGLIDTIVVYKVDRLTRSLADFAKMVERFDAKGVSFVSVTQAFNTTTSMGRLTLNVLLSFAQFEREVTGERIRDKIAASKAKGMWMGGVVPLGYDVKDRALVVNEPEAEQVRQLYRLYLQSKSAMTVIDKADQLGLRSKARVSAAGEVAGGSKLTRGSLYKILSNPLYIGQVEHKGQRHPGLHAPILDPKLYNAVQKLLEGNRRKRLGSASKPSGLLLTGRVVDASGNRMASTHTGKGNRRYHYYANSALRVPAGELDELIGSTLAQHLGDPQKLGALLPDLTLLTDTVIAKAGAIASGDRPQMIAAFDAKVTLGSAGATITLKLDAIGIAGEMSLTVPTLLTRAKTRLALVVPGPHNVFPDPVLIGVIAQAREWFEALTSGKHNSIASIAHAENLDASWMGKFIGAAFLAPDLVTRIVEGRQPRSLTAEKLKSLLPLPHDWQAQRALFAQLN